MDIDPDALAAYDDPDEDDVYAGLPWNHCARFDGHPGMVWFATSRPTRGDKLKIGDWLDTLNHSGARPIYGIVAGPAPAGGGTPDAEHLCGLGRAAISSGLRTVLFGGGGSETVRDDVLYDVVDPDAQVTPDGTPVVFDDPPSDDAGPVDGPEPR